MKMKTVLSVQIAADMLPITMIIAVLLDLPSAISNSGVHNIAEIVITGLVAFFVLILIHCSLNSSYIHIDEYCVKRIFEIRFFTFVIYSEVLQIKWVNVEKFEKGFAGYFSGYRIWGFDDSGKRKMIILNNISTNLVCAVELILNKLPEDKIDAKLITKELNDR